MFNIKLSWKWKKKHCQVTIWSCRFWRMPRGMLISIMQPATWWRSQELSTTCMSDSQARLISPSCPRRSESTRQVSVKFCRAIMTRVLFTGMGPKLPAHISRRLQTGIRHVLDPPKWCTAEIGWDCSHEQSSECSAGYHRRQGCRAFLETMWSHARYDFYHLHEKPHCKINITLRVYYKVLLIV